MSDVFISYSRSDSAFAERLHAALVGAGHSVWIDTQDIFPTAQWAEEIFAAIDGAAAFVYIITPDSVDSEVCTRELRHAIDNRKTIIPVVLREVDQQQVLEPVRALNWIFFCRGDGFDVAFGKVVLVLGTDLGHWQQAAQLLVRARRWEARGRERGLTLRGAELSEAERWLAAAADQEPRPTPLHHEFLARSRTARNRRQRIAVGVLATISVVLLTLSVVSVTLYRREQAARAEAIAQRDEAVSRQASLLAAQVDSALGGGQPDRALLLALKATQTRDNSVTRSSLLRALTYSPHLGKVLKGHSSGDGVPSDGVADVVFGPADGTLLSAGAGDGTVVVWIPSTGRRTVMALPTYRHPYGIFSLAVSADGSRLATAGFDGVWVWDVRTGNQVAVLETATDPLNQDFNLNPLREKSSRLAAFSPSGQTLVTTRCVTQPCDAGKGEMTFWDTRSWKRIRSVGGLNPITSLAFGRGGALLATTTCAEYARDSSVECVQGLVEVWDAKTGARAGSPMAGHSRQALSVAFGRDDRTLASGGADNSVLLWSVDTRRPVGVPLVGHSGPVSRVAFSPDATLLASASQDKTVRLWNVATESVTAETLLGHDAAVQSLAFSPDGRRLASGDNSNTILLWDTGFDMPVGARIVEDASQITSIGFSRDAALMAVGGSNGKVVVHDAATRRVVKDLLTYQDRCDIVTPNSSDATPCYIEGVAFTKDGGRLAAATGDGRLFVWDTRTWAPVGDPLRAPASPCRSVFCVDGNIESFALSQDGAQVALGGCAVGEGLAGCAQGQIWLWDIVNQRLLTRLTGHSERVTTVAFSPDGKKLASGSHDNTIIVWDTAGHNELGALTTDLTAADSSVVSVAFDPTGNRLASYGTEGQVRLWRLDTMSQDGPPIAAATEGSYGAVAFSPDGAYLAAGTWDHEVTVWHVSDRTAIAQPFPHPGQVDVVVFSPDGSMLASGDESSVVSLWDHRMTTWHERACDIAGRNLSLAERDQFAPDGSKVCGSSPTHGSVVAATIHGARELVKAGRTPDAAAAYADAARLAAEGDDADLNNNLCGEGSYHGFAANVLPACERAVRLSPGNGANVDSRGFAHARMGNFPQAAADFQSFADWAQANSLYSDEIIQERRDWIDTLKQDKDPFNTSTLDAIRDEYVPT